MSSEPLSARDLTGRLVAREAATGTPESAARAAQAACEYAFHELTRRLGPTGAQALLTRALAQAQAEHPLLGALRIGRLSERALDGVTDLIDTHGGPAVAAGLETVLERLLGLLGRLIGADMVPRLVDVSAPVGTQDDEEVK